MEPNHGTQSQGLPERRTNAQLREKFDSAARRLQHFFHGHNDWAGTSHDFLALRLVHEHYPELNTKEVRTLVTAIGRRLQAPGMFHKLYV